MVRCHIYESVIARPFTLRHRSKLKPDFIRFLKIHSRPKFAALSRGAIRFSIKSTVFGPTRSTLIQLPKPKNH